MSECDVLVIVSIAGYATADHVVRAREADFLATPFEARELIEGVRRALAGPAGAKEEHP